jgi:hypothetical protein
MPSLAIRRAKSGFSCWAAARNLADFRDCRVPSNRATWELPKTCLKKDPFILAYYSLEPHNTRLEEIVPSETQSDWTDTVHELSLWTVVLNVETVSATDFDPSPQRGAAKEGPDGNGEYDA